MQRGFWVGALVCLAVFAASPNFILKAFYYSNGIFLGITNALLHFPKEADKLTEEIRFTGDVMLARHVETLMRKEGYDYPYRNLESQPNIAWVGNFEATVPDMHTQTKDFAMRFSVDKNALGPLRSLGFTHLSLANNHSYDFGQDTFEKTKRNLSDFSVFGNPTGISDETVTYIQLKDKKIALLGISTVSHPPDRAALTESLQTLQRSSDFQIAYIHWGDEYSLTHNHEQEQLATFLIDSGVDAVIGHHPHVVQDIALYKNKPIFYSLGNFIFDQYFSEAVQEGLVVKLSLDANVLQYELMPVTTLGSTAAPRKMTEAEANTFLTALATRSDGTFSAAVVDGHITMHAE